MRESRSRVHMLVVAAARLEQEGANPKLIADLREAAKLEARRRAEGRDYHAAEERRTAAQRNAFSATLNGPAKEALKRAMLQRAYDLMWDGNCAACDALVEFLPSIEVEQMFQAWEEDNLGKKPLSAFHGRG